MEIFITERAKIGLEHLPPAEKKKAQRLLDILPDFPNSESLKGKIRKASPINEATFYIGRIGTSYRLLFRIENQNIEVFEVVHHDRLKRFLNWNEGGIR